VNSTLYPNLCTGESLKRLRAGGQWPSALPLLVLFLAADHEQHTLAPYDLAVATDFLY
jgi:hypothetical protein